MFNKRSNTSFALLVAVCWLMCAQTSLQLPDNCQEVDYYYTNRCDTCYTGYYVNKLNSYKCEACQANCEACTSGDTCSRCVAGYALNTKTLTCIKLSGRRIPAYILAFGAIALLYTIAILCLKCNKSTQYTPVSANPFLNQQQQVQVANPNMYQYQPQPQAAPQLPPGFS